MALATDTVQAIDVEYFETSEVDHSEVEQGYQGEPETVETVKTLDLLEAQKFITALTGSPDTRMTFRTFLEAKGAKGYPHTPKGSVKALATELERLNNEGSGVFCTVQQATGDKAQDVTAIRALFVDFDGHLPTGSEWHLQPSIIVETSDKKGHAYWVLSEPIAMSDKELTAGDNSRLEEILNPLLSRLVAHYYKGFGSDFAAMGISRVTRLPGSWHSKGAKVPTPVTNVYLGSERYSVDEAMAGISNDPKWLADILAQYAIDKAKKEGKADKAKGKGKLSNTPSLPSGKNKDFDRMLAAAVAKVANCTEGGRNSTLNTEARTLAGLFPDKVGIIRSGLSEAAITCGLLLPEIGSTLDSAIKAGILKPITTYGSSGSGKPNILTLDADIAAMGETVRLNQMTNKVEVGGTLLDLNQLRRFTIQKFGYALSSEDCKQCWVGAAEENKYNPVQEYLLSLPDTTPTLDLSTLALTLLGNESIIAAIMLKRKLIACVARAMKPGCKEDSLLVLVGAQGARKSSFIEALASDEWFSSDLSDITSKDHLRLLVENWLLELGEVDDILNNKTNEAFKKFTAAKKDTYRPVFRLENETAQRSSSLWATTNKTELLNDPTGSRRYWVMMVNKKIDITHVVSIRDSIWFSALQAYNAGEQWHLTDDEEIMQQEAAKQFTEVDIWAETLDLHNVVLPHGGGWVATYQKVLENLGVHGKNQDRLAKKRVGAVMLHFGFEFKKVKVDGKSNNYWQTNTKTW